MSNIRVLLIDRIDKTVYDKQLLRAEYITNDILDEFNVTRRSEKSRNQRAKIQRKRVFIKQYLARKHCVDCGCKDELTFDHVRGVKRAGVTQLLLKGYRVILTEIAKCDIRCDTCHRKRHGLIKEIENEYSTV